MFPKDDQQKNLLMAFLLSALVLMGWHYFYAGPKLKEEQERQARLKSQQETVSPGSPGVSPAPKMGADGTPAVPGATIPGVTAPARAASREEALAQSPRIAVDTPSLKGSIALKGGRIDDLHLVKYLETLQPGSPTVTLFSPAGAPNPYFAEHGWLAADPAVKVPDRDSVWTAVGAQTLRPSQPVTLTWDNGQGLKFRRTISVDDHYLFAVTDEVENATASAVTLHPYARIFRMGTPKVEGFWILHEGLIGVFGEQGLQEVTYSDAIKDKSVAKEGDALVGGWLGITDKYWAASLIPGQTAPFRANLAGTKKSATERESFHASYMLQAMTVAPGAKAATSSHLFAGAKQFRAIEQYEKDLSIKRFDLMIDWGWFRFFTKPLYRLIHWLYELLGNFGLAILATTVIVKAGLFWFANKSYASMAKMKKLQPEMEKIRERFKDDRMAQQQAMMELYKTEKVNPMAGCLPIIPQGFILFALYKVLFITIDARHAPFYGWIKDLSAPDPTSIFNLFGLLPWSPPEIWLIGGTIGVWPVIMAITMWFQMQLNPQQPDPIQQKIFSWMPVFFLFIMATFSSGLVIYWAWSNTLTLIQQYWIMKKHGADIHLWKNLGVERWLKKGSTA